MQALVPVVLDDAKPLDRRPAVVEHDGLLFQRQAAEQVLHPLFDGQGRVAERFGLGVDRKREQRGEDEAEGHAASKAGTAPPATRTPGWPLRFPNRRSSRTARAGRR